MLELIPSQRGHLQVTLHGEHLGHRVGNRRAGREDHAPTFVPLLNVLHFQKKIERTLGCRLQQTGDAGHLGDVEQILELVRLINEEPVNPEFLEGQRVVLLVLGGERFEFRGQPFFHPLQFRHEPRAAVALLLADGFFDFVNLPVNELATRLDRHGDFLEARSPVSSAVSLRRIIRTL